MMQDRNPSRPLAGPDPVPRKSWSEIDPRLQIGIDSTSLGEFKTCPRRYYLGIQLGWKTRQTSVDLIFGGLVHRAYERYHKSRHNGGSHEESLAGSLRWAMSETWNKSLGRPTTDLDDNIKNRLSLARAIVWGLDEMVKTEQADPLKTLILSDGSPAVELSFRFESGYKSRLTGEDFLLCGHLDRLVEFMGRPYVEDVKTTKHPLDARWLESFSPDNQFSLYVLAGQVIWQEPLEGLIISGIQIGVNFVRGPRRQLIPRTKPTLEEWHRDLGWWLQRLEDCVEEDIWPQNDKACFRCQFRHVCARPPAQRQVRLEADFQRRVWDPLEARL